MKYELIIFDIDNTLFDSIEPKKSKTKTKPDHQLTHGGIKYKMYGRPFLKKFMKFCKNNFKDLALWTHADDMWLDKFIKNILGQEFKFLFKYDINKASYTRDGYKLKPLSKVYAEFPKYNKHNTLIIEDTPGNCIENMENCIIVPEFSIIKHENESPDIVLPLLSSYIMKLQTGKIHKHDPIKWYNSELEEFKKRKVSKASNNKSITNTKQSKQSKHKSKSPKRKS